MSTFSDIYSNVHQAFTSSGVLKEGDHVHNRGLMRRSELAGPGGAQFQRPLPLPSLVEPLSFKETRGVPSSSRSATVSSRSSVRSQQRVDSKLLSYALQPLSPTWSEQANTSMLRRAESAPGLAGTGERRRGHLTPKPTSPNNWPKSFV